MGDYDSFLELINYSEIYDIKEYYYKYFDNNIHYNSMEHKYAIIKACYSYSSVIILKWLFSLNKYEINWNREDIDNILIILCETDHFDALKWLYTYSTFTFKFNIDCNYPIYCALNNKNILFADWIFEKDISSSFISCENFALLCKNNELISAKWAITKNIQVITSDKNIDINNNYNILLRYIYDENFRKGIFNSVCSSGFLDMLSWLIKLYDYNRGFFEERTLILNKNKWNPSYELINTCLSSGHLHIIEYLKNTYNINSTTYYTNTSFNIICGNGCRDIINFIINKNSQYAKYINTTALCSACQKQNVEYIEWLINLNPTLDNYIKDVLSRSFNEIIISFIRENPFISACMFDNISVVKWLYHKQPKIIKYVNFNLMKFCIIHGSYETFIWLFKSYEYYNDININKLFELSFENSRFNFISWLCTYYCSYINIHQYVNINNSDFQHSVYLYVRIIINLIEDSLLPEFKTAIQILDSFDNFDISVENDIIFRSALELNNFEIIKFLIDKYHTIDVIQNGCLMLNSCSPNYDLVEWIFNINNNIEIDEKAMIKACDYPPNLDTITFLHNKNPNIINGLEHSVFQNLCANNSYDEVVWFIQNKSNLDIEYDFHAAFKDACNCDAVKVAKYLESIKPEIYSVMCGCTLNNNECNCDVIIDYKINQNIQFKGCLIKLNNLIELKNNEICCVCYENNNELITICNHAFCYSCMNTHYKRKNNCPYCRKELKIDDFKKIILKE
jgi:hypothetical protein